MAVSVVPALIDALVAAATAALPNVLVLDGMGATDDPGDYLMVGVDDPDTDGDAFSGDSQQKWAHATGSTRDELGQITCAAFSWNGNGDQKAARDSAYASVEALAAACRDSVDLGVDSIAWVDFGTDARLSQIQSDSGAAALVVFQIAFRARI